MSLKTEQEKAQDCAADSEATPLIRQYHRIKSQHPDHVVFFRCGDFYEMFHDDAKLASQILGITLTSRGSNSRGELIPLAGVPYHSVEPYLAKMIRAGRKVAICEQMENPKNAKGVVRREVVRVVTPGTVLEDNLLDTKANNYMAAIVEEKGSFGFAALDFSTGQFAISEFAGRDSERVLCDEITRLSPSEIIVFHDQRSRISDLIGQTPSGDLMRTQVDSHPSNISSVSLESGSLGFAAARELLLQKFGVRDLNGFGAEQEKIAVRAAGVVLEYLRDIQVSQPVHLNELRVYHPGDYMLLDQTTQRSLELVSNLTDATKRHTLLEVLDHTCTGMGGRLLRQWILQPLRRVDDINARLDAVDAFTRNATLRGKTAERLRLINDLERIVSRASCRTANPRDLLALRNSLQQIPPLVCLMTETAGRGNGSAGNETSFFNSIAGRLDPLPELTSRLEEALVENPPVTVREGGIFKEGFNTALDELRSVSTDSKSWIASMRQQEIERTGISTLKIGYNKVFGYYIEVSNSHLGKIPAEYIRKQTLVNAERFITQELKEKEEIILHSQERIHEIEFQLFEELRDAVSAEAREIQQTARAVAELDAISSLAHVAVTGNYCRPCILTESNDPECRPALHPSAVHIVDGRHPVLESLNLDQPFVPNDTLLDGTDNQILLITGPNMAGKSTYIRQVALITLMAHMGSFVPAREARVGLVDRIFTRVGAMDQLAKGQSTFLVEMSETANILNNASDQSLVILDEIGRGTSTYDGLSIAWAVIEYLHNTKGRRPKTLFATHYHELVDLEGVLPRLKNYNVAVLEEEGRVAFLYKILRGSTDKSYGIYAAQVAGLPRPAIDRAKAILKNLEEGNAVEISPRGGRQKSPDPTLQLTFFDAAPDPFIEQLKTIDIEKMTPLQSLSILAEFVAKARSGK